MNRNASNARSNLNMLYDILLCCSHGRDEVAEYRKIRDEIGKVPAAKSFDDFLELAKRDLFDRLNKNRDIVLAVLTGLCIAANDLPIRPRREPKTLFELGPKTLSNYLESIGIKRRKGFHFIGITPNLEKDEARKQAIIGLLFKFDEPLR